MKRIQLKRTKGYRKPEGAINVTRSTKWGNPFKIGETIHRDSELAPYLDIPGGWGALVDVRMLRQADVVSAHFRWVIEQPDLMFVIDELRGHDLACYCPIGTPCHADTLLYLANPEGEPW